MNRNDRNKRPDIIISDTDTGNICCGGRQFIGPPVDNRNKCDARQHRVEKGGGNSEAGKRKAKKREY